VTIGIGIVGAAGFWSSAASTIFVVIALQVGYLAGAFARFGLGARRPARLHPAARIPIDFS